MYLNANKDRLNDMTTQALNKSYHIDGYRITRRKGELCLIAAHEKPNDEHGITKCLRTQSEIAERLSAAEDTINRVLQQIDVLTNAVNQLITGSK